TLVACVTRSWWARPINAWPLGPGAINARPWRTRTINVLPWRTRAINVRPRRTWSVPVGPWPRWSACTRTRRTRAINSGATVIPAMAFPVERAIAVPTIPIIAELEGDHRNPDAGRIFRQINPAVVVEHLQVITADPASHASPGGIAPTPAAGATVHIHSWARRNGRNPRLLSTGNGAHVHGAGGVGVLG